MQYVTLMSAFYKDKTNKQTNEEIQIIINIFIFTEKKKKNGTPSFDKADGRKNIPNSRIHPDHSTFFFLFFFTLFIYFCLTIFLPYVFELMPKNEQFL